MRRRSRRAVAWLLTLALFIGMLPSGLLSTLVQAFTWNTATLEIDPTTGKYTVTVQTGGDAGNNAWAVAVIPNIGTGGSQFAPSNQKNGRFSNTNINSQSNLSSAVTELQILEGTYNIQKGSGPVNPSHAFTGNIPSFEAVKAAFAASDKTYYTASGSQIENSAITEIEYIAVLWTDTEGDVFFSEPFTYAAQSEAELTAPGITIDATDPTSVTGNTITIQNIGDKLAIIDSVTISDEANFIEGEGSIGQGSQIAGSGTDSFIVDAYDWEGLAAMGFAEIPITVTVTYASGSVEGEKKTLTIPVKVIFAEAEPVLSADPTVLHFYGTTDGSGHVTYTQSSQNITLTAESEAISALSPDFMSGLGVDSAIPWGWELAGITYDDDLAGVSLETTTTITITPSKTSPATVGTHTDTLDIWYMDMNGAAAAQCLSVTLVAHITEGTVEPTTYDATVDLTIGGEKTSFTEIEKVVLLGDGNAEVTTADGTYTDGITFTGLEDSKTYSTVRVYVKEANRPNSAGAYYDVPLSSTISSTQKTASAKLVRVTLGSGSNIQSATVGGKTGPILVMEKTGSIALEATTTGGTFTTWTVTPDGEATLDSAASPSTTLTVKTKNVTVTPSAETAPQKYSGTVTVNLNGKAWTDSGYTFTVTTDGGELTDNSDGTYSYTDFTGGPYTVHVKVEKGGQTIVDEDMGSISGSSTDLTANFYTVQAQAATGGTIQATYGTHTSQTGKATNGEKIYVPAGKTVNLTATPDEDYKFGSWSVTGSSSPSNTQTATINITAETTVTASFTEAVYGGTITIQLDGSPSTTPGTVTLYTNGGQPAADVQLTDNHDGTYTYTGANVDAPYYSIYVKGVKTQNAGISKSNPSPTVNFYTVTLGTSSSATMTLNGKTAPVIAEAQTTVNLIATAQSGYTGQATWHTKQPAPPASGTVSTAPGSSASGAQTTMTVTGTTEVWAEFEPIEMGSLSSTSSAFTWDLYEEKVTPPVGGADGFTTTISVDGTVPLQEITSITYSVGNKTLTSTTHYTVSQTGAGNNDLTLTMTNAQLKTLGLGLNQANETGVFTVTVAGTNGQTKQATVVVTATDTMPWLTGVELSDGQGHTGSNISGVVSTGEPGTTLSVSTLTDNKDGSALGSGNVTYTWYRQDPDGSKEPIPDADGSTYTIPTSGVEPGTEFTVEVKGNSPPGTAKNGGAELYRNDKAAVSATFTVIAPTHTVTLVIDPSGGGSVRVNSQTYSAASQTITVTGASASLTGLTAHASQGYRFKQWTTTGGTLSAANETTTDLTNITQDVTLTATFAPIPILSLTTNSGSGPVGTAPEGGQIPSFTIRNTGQAAATNVTITITGLTAGTAIGNFTIQKTGNAPEIVSWTDNKDGTVTATIANIPSGEDGTTGYTYQLIPNTTLPAGSYSAPVSVKYKQVSTDSDGLEVTGTPSYTFTEREYTIVVNKDTGISSVVVTKNGQPVELGGGNSFTAGSKDTIIITSYASSGYTQDGWTVETLAGGASPIETPGTLTFTPSGSGATITVTAKAKGIAVLSLDPLKSEVTSPVNELTTSTTIYSGTLSNSGEAASQTVSYALRQKGDTDYTSYFTLTPDASGVVNPHGSQAIKVVLSQHGKEQITGAGTYEVNLVVTEEGGKSWTVPIKLTVTDSTVFEGSVTINVDGASKDGATVTLAPGDSLTQTTTGGTATFQNLLVSNTYTITVDLDGDGGTYQPVPVTATLSKTNPNVTVDFYTVSLKADPDSISTTLKGAGIYESGTKVTIEASTDAEGYRFDGWTNDDASNVSVSTSSQYTFTIGGKVNYTAHFSRTYTVQYLARPGDGSVSNLPTDPKGYYDGDEVTIPTAVPTRPGYTFAGWSTADDGTAEYQAGGKFTIALDGSGGLQPDDENTIKLYAVWQNAALVNPDNQAGLTTTYGAQYAYDAGALFRAKNPGIPLTYEITAGTLPGGLAFDETTGVISGRPYEVTTKSVTITATHTDNSAATATVDLTLTVNKATPVVTITGVTGAVDGAAFDSASYSVAVTAPRYTGSGWTDSYVILSGTGTATDINAANSGKGTISVGSGTFTTSRQDVTITYNPTGASATDGNHSTYDKIYNSTSGKISAAAVNKTWGIAVNPETLAFQAQEGYASVTEQSFTVTNTGNQPTGALTVTPSSGFELTGANASNTDPLAPGESRTYQVRPVTGKTADGSPYTGTVTVNDATNSKNATVNLVFNVTRSNTFTGTVITNLNPVDGPAAPGDVTSVTLRPFGTTGSSDVTAIKTDTGTYTAGSLDTGTIYQVIVNGYLTSELVYYDRKEAAVNLYQILTEASPALAGTTTPSDSYYVSGQTVTLSASNNSSYKFTSWHEDTAEGSQVSTNANHSLTVTEAQKFVAVYEQGHKVTYSAPDKDSGRVPTDDMFYFVGDTVYVKSGGDLQKTGYTFAGWNDGNKTYKPGESFTMGAAAVTLTAQWTPLPLSLTGGTFTVAHNDSLSEVIKAVGGEGQITYAIAGAGNLAGSGLTLGSNGAFTGTATYQGSGSNTYTIEVTATAAGSSTKASFTIEVVQAVTKVTEGFAVPVGLVVFPGDSFDISKLGSDNLTVKGYGTDGVKVTKDDFDEKPTTGGTATDGTWTVTPDKWQAGSVSYTLTFTPSDPGFLPCTTTVTIGATNKLITAADVTVPTPSSTQTPAETKATITTGKVIGNYQSIGTVLPDETVTVQTNWNATSFTAGQSYTATVVLTPTGDWKFDPTSDGDDWTATVTAPGAKTTLIYHDDKSVILSVVFPAEDQKIDGVHVNVTAPADGATPDNTAIPTGTPLGSFTASDVKWYEGTSTSGETPFTGPFVGGRQYTVVVTAKPTTGYTFDPDIFATEDSSNNKATINRQNATIVSKSESQVVIAYTFTAQTDPVRALTNASGPLVYYIQTGTTDKHYNNQATGHKVSFGFTMSAADFSATIVRASGDTATVTGTDLKLFIDVDGDGSYDELTEDIPAAFNSDNAANLNGKTVYALYAPGGMDAGIAPTRVGKLVLNELTATGITSTASPTLSYTSGANFDPASGTATVTFNSGTAMANQVSTMTAGAKPTTVTTPAANGDYRTTFYYMLDSDRNGVIDDSDKHIDASTTLSASDHGKTVYACYTDVNGNLVYTPVGQLSMDSQHTAGITDANGGDAEYGDKLTAQVSPGDSGDYYYRWEKEDSGGDWQPIPGATSPTYYPDKGDVGEDIRVVVIDKNTGKEAHSDPETIEKRSLNFVVNPFDKYYDGDATNKHTYTIDDFTLTAVGGTYGGLVNNDQVTLKLNGGVTAPAYSGATMGSTITWPAVSEAGTGESGSKFADYTLGGPNGDYYRLAPQGEQTDRGEILADQPDRIIVTNNNVTPVTGAEPDRTPGNYIPREEERYDVPDDGTVVWEKWNGASWEPVNEPDTFQPDTTYRVTIPVRPVNGTELSSEPSNDYAYLEIGGKLYPAQYTPASDGKDATMTVQFAPTAAIGKVNVTHVDVSFEKLPALGETIPATPTSVTDPRETQDGDKDGTPDTFTAHWYVSDTQPTSFGTIGTPVTGPDAKFEASKYYTVVVHVAPKDGYAYNPGTSAGQTRFYFFFGQDQGHEVTDGVITVGYLDGVYTMYYTFTTQMDNPPSNILGPEENEDSLPVLGEDKLLYYAATTNHNAAQRGSGTIPGDKTSVLFTFNGSVNAQVEYADGTKAVLNDLNYGTLWTIVAGDTPETAVALPGDKTFTRANRSQYDGKNLYIQVDGVILKDKTTGKAHSLGTLTVKELEAQAITKYDLSGGKDLSDLLHYTEGDTFKTDVITSATVAFNTDVAGLNTSYVASTFGSAADATSFYFELANGTALTAESKVGGDDGDVKNGDMIYLCYTDVNGNEVRQALGSIVVSEGTKITVTVTNVTTSTPNATEASYGDELKAVVEGDHTGTLSYQWQRWDEGSSQWTDIPGATGPTYTAARDDVDADGTDDNNLRVLVKEHGKDGEAVSAAAAAAAVDVNKADLTVTFTAENKVWDGTTDANVNGYKLSGVVDGDVITLTGYGTTGTFASPDVVNGITVTVDTTHASLSFKPATDTVTDYYDVVYVNPTANITALQVSWNDLSFNYGSTKRYDGTTDVYLKNNTSYVTDNTAVDGNRVLANETITADGPVTWTALAGLSAEQKEAIEAMLTFNFAFDTKDAGLRTKTITATATVGGTANSNIDLSAFQSNEGKYILTEYGTINPKRLTVSKDNLTPPTTIQGGATGVTINGTVASGVGSEGNVDFTVQGAFDSTAEATSKNVTILGVKKGTSNGITWANGNYVLIWNGDDNTMSGTVTGGTVVSVEFTGSASAIYGDGYNTVQGLGFKVGYDTGGDGRPDFYDTTATTFALLKNLGVVAVIEDYADGSAKYYLATDSGKTVGWDNATGTSATLNFKLFLEGDATDAATAWNSAASLGNGTIAVNQRGVTVDAEWNLDAADKEGKYYDGTTAAKGSVLDATAGNLTTTVTGSIAFTLGNVMPGDSAVTVAGSYEANFTDSNAGENKTINVTGVTLTGQNANRYKITGAVTAIGDIKPRPITVTFDSPSVPVNPADTEAAKTVNLYKTDTQTTNSDILSGDTVTVSATGKYRSVATVADSVNVTVSGVIWDNANYTVTVAPLTGKVTSRNISNVSIVYKVPTAGATTGDTGYVSPVTFSSQDEVTVTNTLWQEVTSLTDLTGGTTITDGTFQSGKYYMVTATVEAKAGYQLTSNTYFTLNSGTMKPGGATPTNMSVALSGNTATVKYIFHVPAVTVDKVISKVSANVIQPVAGAAIATDAAALLLAQNKDGVDLTAQAEVGTVNWTVTGGGAATGTFAYGTSYTATFVVKVKDASAAAGYSFLNADPDFVDFLINGVTDGTGNWINGAGTATKNGVKVTTTKGADANTYTVSVEFPATTGKNEVFTIWGEATVPTAGATASATNIDKMDGQPYLAVVSGAGKTEWLHNGAAFTGTFSAGETYTAKLTVKIDDAYAGSYQFAADPDGYINDATPGATTVTNNGDGTVTLTREFTVPLQSLIVHVSSNIPTDGADGTTVSNTITAGIGHANRYTVDGQWYTDQTGTTPVTTFEKGKTYYLIADVSPAAGYVLPDGVNGYIWDQGSVVAIQVGAAEGDGGRQVVFKYTIPNTSGGQKTPMISVTEPVADQKPDFAPTSPNDSVTILPGTTWTDGSGNAMGADDTFKAGGSYTVRVNIDSTSPDGSVVYNPGDTVYLDGKAVEVKQDADTGGLYVEYTWTLPKEEGGGGVIVVPSDKPVVTYWLGEKGVTDDLTAEKVDKGSKPSFTPDVTGIDGYVFIGWSETDPTGVADPVLVDPLTFVINADKTFYAVYERSEAEHEHFVKGYPDGTFQPNGYITRAEVAVLIARSLLDGYVEANYYGDGGYSDVAGHWALSAIAFCKNVGVMNGYPDGTFRPNEPITRQEFALAFARMGGLRVSAGLTFADADQVSDWAEDGVYTCVANGWINGYPDGTFRPLQNITRAEAVTLVNHYLNRGVDETGLEQLSDGDYKTWPDVPTSHWAYYEILEASNDHSFYYQDAEEGTPPEAWTDAWIDWTSWGI